VLDPERARGQERSAPRDSQGWQSVQDVETLDTGLGVHFADLLTEKLSAGQQAVFTFHWPQADKWEQTDFAVTVQ
jgi:glucoamylase